jgi:hypothetical protein
VGVGVGVSVGGWVGGWVRVCIGDKRDGLTHTHTHPFCIISGRYTMFPNLSKEFLTKISVALLALVVISLKIMPLYFTVTKGDNSMQASNNRLKTTYEVWFQKQMVISSTQSDTQQKKLRKNASKIERK